jgi:DNA (cytosine-5)-methyltransferase 1
LKAYSLFSGAGGFELGFDKAGIDTVLQAENNRDCVTILHRHWPEREKIFDVRKVTTGNPDLIYGGFPCQDVSIAGSRAGVNGKSSSLWYEFERILRVLQPRWAVIENVVGLLSSNNGSDFRTILSSLDDIGYDAAWAVLDAQFFGVPQRRRRVFIVAGPRGKYSGQVLHLCESCHGYSSKNKKIKIKNRPSIKDRFRKDNIPRIANTLTTSSAISLEYVSQHRIFPWNGSVRKLTPLEGERLMGWPDDWTRWAYNNFEMTDKQRYKMIGNGVVAPVAEWIGHRLVAIDKQLYNSSTL